MTNDERLDLIDRLKREADEGRARIAERVAAREADPFSEQERLLADRRATGDESDLAFTEPSEPEPSPPVQRNDAERVIYRRYDGNPSAHAVDGDDDVFNADPYLTLAAFHETMPELIVELRREWRQEREAAIAPLNERIARLEAQVETLTALLAPKSKLWTP